jgi:hypothetical protein
MKFDVEGDLRLKQQNSLHANEKRIAEEQAAAQKNTARAAQDATAAAVVQQDDFAKAIEGNWASPGLDFDDPDAAAALLEEILCR